MYDFTTLPKRKYTGAYKWKEVEDLFPDNGDIIPLSVADMELLNPPEITAALKDFLSENVLGYGFGTEGYYNAVCSWMQERHGWQISKDWILEWPGVVPAFYDAVCALTEPGDKVMMTSPVYYPFFSAAADHGRQVADVPLLFDGTNYSVDFPRFEKTAQDPKVKVFLLCSPHNPVGRLWTREELEKMGRICIDNGVFVISDEIHFDLILPGNQHTVFASISGEFAQNSVICTAPSKTFNLAGLQVSNVIVANAALRETLQKMHRAEGFIDLNVLGYKACETAYTQCAPWLDKLLQLVEHNRRFVTDYLAENIPQLRALPMQATYLLWADFRAFPWRGKELSDRLKTDAGLFLDDGFIFGPGGDGFERINLACPTYVLEKAMQRLKAFAEKYI